MGGRLVTLASGEDSHFVSSLATTPDTGPGSPWLGGYQPPGSPEPDGGWCWVTGEPNESDGEHTLIFWGGPVWNDWTD